MISIAVVDGSSSVKDPVADGVACRADDGVIPICVRGGGADWCWCCCIRDEATAVGVALADDGVIPNCAAILFTLVCVGGGGGGGGAAVGVALAVEGVIASFPVVLIDELFGAALLGDVLVKVKPVGRFVMALVS
jgi:predicted Rossmann-fold nucleotide-binding protein